MHHRTRIALERHARRAVDNQAHKPLRVLRAAPTPRVARGPLRATNAPGEGLVASFGVDHASRRAVPTLCA